MKFILAILFAIVLSGCGGSETSTNNNEPTTWDNATWDNTNWQ